MKKWTRLFWQRLYGRCALMLLMVAGSVAAQAPAHSEASRQNAYVLRLLHEARFDLAHNEAQQAVALAIKEAGTDSFAYVTALHQLGVVQLQLGHPAEAFETFEAGVAPTLAAVGPVSIPYVTFRQLQANALRDLGRLEEAQLQWMEAWRQVQGNEGAFQPMFSSLCSEGVAIALERRDVGAAEDLLLRLEAAAQRNPQTTPNDWVSIALLRVAWESLQGNQLSAAAVWRDVRDRIDRNPLLHGLSGRISLASTEGRLASARGDLAVAIEAHSRARKLANSLPSPVLTDAVGWEIDLELADALIDNGDLAEAEPLVAHIARSGHAQGVRRIDAMILQGQIMMLRAKPEAGRQQFEAARAILERDYPLVTGKQAQLMRLLAMAAQASGDLPRARQLLFEGLALTETEGAAVNYDERIAIRQELIPLMIAQGDWDTVENMGEAILAEGRAGRLTSTQAHLLGILNMAVAAHDQGEPQAALEWLEKAAPVIEVQYAKNSELRLATDSIRASIMLSLGRPQSALPLFKRVQRVLRAKPLCAPSLYITSGIGLSKTEVLLAQEAAGLARLQSLVNVAETWFPSDSLILLRARLELARFHLIRLGDIETGVEILSRCQLVVEALPVSHPERIAFGVLMGSAQNDLGNADEARSMLATAVSHLFAQQHTHPQNTASILNTYAVVLHDQGETALAKSVLHEALARMQGTSGHLYEWTLLSNLAELYADSGEPLAAIFFGKKAVNALQRVRIQVDALGPEYSTAFLLDNEDVYRQLFDFLVEEGRLSEAQEVWRLLKAEELFQLTRGAARSEIVEPGLPLSAEETAVDLDFKLKLEALHGILATSSVDREGVQAEIAALFLQLLGDGQGAETLSSETEMNTMVAQLAGQPRRTAWLQYVVLDDGIRIVWTVDGQSGTLRQTVSRGDLGREVEALRQGLRSPFRSAEAAAKKLYDTVFAPVARVFATAEVERIWVSTDGVLRYVPFAALHDGSNYLVEHYELQRVTPRSIADPDDVSDEAVSVSAFGASRAFADLPDLPHVVDELEAIVQDVEVGSEGLFPGRIVLDDAFTREAFERELGHDRPLVHLATHYVFRAGNAANSELALGGGGSLTLREIWESSLRFPAVELICLSGCETGVGSVANGNGVEIEGLAQVVQHHGAARVLASLWRIDDRATAKFMRSFYVNLQRGEEKVAALRIAQNVMRNRPEWRHPFFWAGFILQGRSG